MKTNNEAETNGEDEKEKMLSLEDANNAYIEYPVEEEALMVRSTEYSYQDGWFGRSVGEHIAHDMSCS